MVRLLTLFTVVTLIATPAFALTDSKTGEPVDIIPPDVPGEPSTVRADWEYNTGGSMDFVPDTGGSYDGWGEWFITTAYNDSGQDLVLQEFGWPCCGPPTETYGWVVWLDMGGYNPPVGDAYTAEYYGPYTPVDPAPDTFPPTVYTYIDVSGEGIVVPANTYFCFGYDNTGNGGQTSYNGVQTWAWYSGMWDPDESWGRTAILQVKANYSGGTPTELSTWGRVKALF